MVADEASKMARHQGRQDLIDYTEDIRLCSKYNRRLLLHNHFSSIGRMECRSMGANREIQKSSQDTDDRLVWI